MYSEHRSQITVQMASQVSVAWTLEGLKTIDEKFHLTDTPAAAASPAGAVTAGLGAHQRVSPWPPFASTVTPFWRHLP